MLAEALRATLWRISLFAAHPPEGGRNAQLTVPFVIRPSFWSAAHSRTVKPVKLAPRIVIRLVHTRPEARRQYLDERSHGHEHRARSEHRHEQHADHHEA
jgi:hypothetical protein